VADRIQFSPQVRLNLTVIGSGLIYLAFTLAFPLSRYYAVNPPVDYAKLTHHSVFGFAAYLAGITALFGLYVLGLRSLSAFDSNQTPKKTLRFVFLCAVVFALILLFSYPQTAIDILVYALHSRGWALYGLSPFTSSTNAFPANDPWLGLAGEWAGSASPYGPVWEWLSLGAYYLSGGNYLGQLFVLKVISLLAYLGSAWLVYQILRLIRPKWAITGLALFAWNPLVLFESVQNGHNDIVMVFFLLMAIRAYVRLMQNPASQWPLWLSAVFVIAFALSILVKFITLLLLPFLLLGLAFRSAGWGRRILIMALYGAAIISISVLVMLPYWPGVENWAVLQAGRGAGRSLFALLVLTFIPRTGNTSAAFDFTSILIYSIFGAIYLWGLWLMFSHGLKKTKKRNISLEAVLETSLRVSFYIFFWYVLIVATVFHAWYLLWFLPLAAFLIPEVRPLSGALIFSLMALLIIPYYETIRVWIPYLNQNHWWGHLIGVTVLLVPVLLFVWKPLRILPEVENP
jgi:hypothetical protein